MSEIMYAAYLGKMNRVKDLVYSGADVNAQDARGYTALMLSCREGNYDIAIYLIGCKADTTLKDKNGLTAEMHAKECGHLDIARLFEEQQR